MRKIILAVSAAAMAVTMPAIAQGQGQGKGKGQNVRAQQNVNVNQNRARAQVRTDVRGDHWVRTENGSWVRVGANGQLTHPQGCPPGLAKRTPSCIPPGQVKHMYRVGQRVPTNYRYYTDYEAIPELYRERFSIPTGYRYIYRDNTVYVVDPRTRLVNRIIDLLL